MRNTLSYLGSTELYTRLIDDLNDLLQSAYENNLTPIQLLVGKIFIEMSCCHTLISDLEIQNWEALCQSSFHEISSLLRERVMEILNSIAAKDGYLGTRESVDIYYSPDEPYLSLLAVSPEKSNDIEEYTTGDGFPIRKLFFKEEEYALRTFLH